MITKKKYAQQHESLSQGIKNYHKLEIPVAFQDFNIDRSSDTLAHNKSLRAIYEDTYKDYTGYIEYPACMDSYYNIAKAINAVELRRQHFALPVALKNYILKYVAKNKINKVYALNSVIFSDKRSDGRDMPIAYFDPNINELRFSSNIRTHFFNEQSKSVQALTLMHEIEHASQAPWLHTIPAERQADERSVEECNCSICLQVKAAMLKNVVMPSGYLTSEDFACHARQSTFRCKAHTDHDITELQAALQSGDKLKIKEIDDAMGTIFDRLPKVD